MGVITRAGDPRAQVALFEAAHVMLPRVARWHPLQAWAMRAAARRPKFALACKRAVIRHHL